MIVNFLSSFCLMKPLGMQLQMEVLIKTVTGRNITLEFENPELAEHVKVRVKSEMHIFVETGDERIKLMVERTQTVGSLKQLIPQTKETMISVDNMSPRYLGNKFQDLRTLADTNIWQDHYP